MMIKKILTVVTIILAMAATTFAGWNAEDGPGGTTTVLNGATLDIGSDDMGSSGGTLDVQVGGTFIHTGEVGNWDSGAHLIVDGTASIGEMKFYGGGAACTVTVGGTLTVAEGFLGKAGVVEMTIGTTGTFIVEGYASPGERFSIDSAEYKAGSGGYASFLDIVGNGRMLLASGDSLRTGHGNAIRGDGVLDNYVVTAGTVGDEIGYDVYTAVQLVPPGTLIFIQ